MKEEFLGIERFEKTGLEQGECFERRERHGSSVCWRCFCIEGTVNTHLYSRLADIVAPLFLTDLVSAQGIRRSY